MNSGGGLRKVWEQVEDQVGRRVSLGGEMGGEEGMS